MSYPFDCKFINLIVVNANDITHDKMSINSIKFEIFYIHIEFFLANIPYI